VGLYRDAQSVTPVSSVVVQLRIPEGQKAQRLRLYEVDSGEQTDLPFEQTGNRVRFTIPSLRVYAIAEVTLQQG
ncbi:MAG: hypothetical protein QXY85_08475, partial [Candidatus Nitrosocaldus sp.]